MVLIESPPDVSRPVARTSRASRLLDYVLPVDIDIREFSQERASKIQRTNRVAGSAALLAAFAVLPSAIRVGETNSLRDALTNSSVGFLGFTVFSGIAIVAAGNLHSIRRVLDKKYKNLND